MSTPDEALYLGLDVGTQGTKGVVISEDPGRGILAVASEPYALIPGLEAGAAEQHPETWVAAARSVIGRLLAHPQVTAPAIQGIGVSGQQHGLVVLDAADAVVRPAKLWCDTTTATESAELSRELGRNVPAGFTAPKILWMRRREPELWARVRIAFLPHDYVNFRLTGTKCCEAGDASGTGYFDPRRRTFDADALAAIDPRLAEMLPPLIASETPAGFVSDAAAAEFGLTAGTLVASGSGDNMMSALGSGATAAGPVVISLGTSGTAFTRSPEPVVDPDGLVAPFCDGTGAWLPLVCVMNMTGVTEEVRSLFGHGMSLDALTQAAAAVPPGCEGLLFLPYLQGERVPDLPRATGALLGLRPDLLRPGHLFRAAMEGTSLNLARGVERLIHLGVTVDAVHLVGGGAGNPLWRHVLADVLQLPVQPLAVSESAALGAAIQASWVARCHRGEEVAAHEVASGYVASAGAAVEPDPAAGPLYRELRDRLAAQTATLFGDS